MAVKSMKYQANLRLPEETKTGFVIWSGNAADYPHWKYRTNLKFRAIHHYKNAEYNAKFCETMVAVGEALRGDALTVQMDIGDDILDPIWEGEGYNKMSRGHRLLMEAMKLKVFPQVEDEAKQMYTEFHTIVFSFSRQPSESMLSFIQRRQLAYALLKELDENRATLSSEMLGDTLLDNSGLNRTEKLLILTSTSNSKKLEDIEEALKKQHPKIHMNEVSRGAHSSRKEDFKKKEITIAANRILDFEEKSFSSG